jgi:serine/threonine protein kinase/WD40 repeat protein
VNDPQRDRVRQIFSDALERPPAQRAEFLDQEAPPGSALRARVDRLLLAAERADIRVTIDDDRRPIDPAHEELADLRAGDLVGRYRLIAPLGEGGFGTVWRVQQEEPVRRELALKLVRRVISTRDAIEWFESERQTLALMDHPNIARMVDGGTTADGQPYLVMELVRGVPIIDFCAAHPLDVRARLQIFLQVCGAIAHAHQRGILHRDIKPANVLVTTEGDRPHVKVIDFGVAQALRRGPRAAGDTDTSVSNFGRGSPALGTPAYLAPEQARRVVDVDRRADVYALGALLYELCTGTPPFSHAMLFGLARTELVRLLEEATPPPPSVVLAEIAAERRTAVRALWPDTAGREARRVRGDLDWIAAAAMEKDRADRYGSVEELADDVRRHLDLRPVLAAPQSRSYVACRLARRHALPLTAAGVAVLALVVALVGLTLGYVEARRGRADADFEAYRALISAASAALDTDDTPNAELLLARAPEALRGWEWRYLEARLDRHARNVVTEHGRVSAAALSADRATLFTGGTDRTVRSWALPEGTLRRTYPLAGRPTRIAVSPDHRWFAVELQEKRRVVTLNLVDGTQLASVEATLPGGGGFSRDGRLLVTLDHERARATLLEMPSGEPVFTIANVPQRGSVWFEGEGAAERVWFADLDRALLLSVELNSGAREEHLSGAGARIMNHHMQHSLSETREGDDIVLFDERSGTQRARLADGGQVLGLSPDGSHALVRDRGLRRLLLYDLDGGEAGTLLRTDRESHHSAGFTAGGSHAFALDYTGGLHIWSLPLDPVPWTVWSTWSAPRRGARIRADGRAVVSGTWGTVQLWETDSGAIRWSTVLSTEYVEHLDFSPDGAHVAVAETRGRLLLLSADDGRLFAEHEGLTGGHTGLSWSADGAHLIVASGDGRIVWLDVADGRIGGVVREAHIFDSAVTSLTLTRDGKCLLATAGASIHSWDYTSHFGGGGGTPSAVLLDAMLGTVVSRFDGPTRGLTAGAVSDDGRNIALGDDSGVIHFFERNGRPTGALDISRRRILHLAFDAEGARLVACSEDEQVTLLDTQRKATLLRMPGQLGGVAAFVPDTDAILVASARPFTEYRASLPDQATRDRRAEQRRLRHLTEPLFSRLLLSEDVVRTLEERTDLPLPQRAAAIEHARRVGDYPQRIESDLLHIVYSRVKSPSAYRRARFLLQCLDRLRPERSARHAALRAWIAVRLGEFDDADRELAELDTTRASDTWILARCVAALCALAQDDPTGARAAYEDVRSVIADLDAIEDQAARTLAAEVERLLR